jgi:hypothetical protein
VCLSAWCVCVHAGWPCVYTSPNQRWASSEQGDQLALAVQCGNVVATAHVLLVQKDVGHRRAARQRRQGALVLRAVRCGRKGVVVSIPPHGLCAVRWRDVRIVSSSSTVIFFPLATSFSSALARVQYLQRPRPGCRLARAQRQHMCAQREGEGEPYGQYVLLKTMMALSDTRPLTLSAYEPGVRSCLVSTPSARGNGDETRARGNGEKRGGKPVAVPLAVDMVALKRGGETVRRSAAVRAATRTEAAVGDAGAGCGSFWEC